MMLGFTLLAEEGYIGIIVIIVMDHSDACRAETDD